MDVVTHEKEDARQDIQTIDMDKWDPLWEIGKNSW
jgi:hypothetical protein